MNPLANTFLRLCASAVAILLLTLVLWPAKLSLEEALKRAYWFHLTDDEAQHAELIEHLTQTDRYGEWRGRPFAPTLTTGPTLIVPASLLQKMTGLPSAHTGRTVSLLYHLGTLALVFVLSAVALWPRPFTTAGWWMAGWIGIGLFHLLWRGLSETHYYIFGILGEGAAVFFILACFLAFIRARFLWAGVFASLAVLSKPYCALLPLSLLICFFWTGFGAWHLRLKSRAFLKSFVSLVSGLALPWIFWIGWMILEMGSSQTFEWWLNYPEIMRETNGAGLPPHLTFQGLLTEFFQKLPLALELFKPRTLLISLAGYAWATYRIFKTQPSKSKPDPVAIILPLIWTFSTLHLAWWFLLSPGAQARYVFPAAVALWISALYFVFAILRHLLSFLKKPPLPYLTITAAFLLVLFVVTAARVSATWNLNRDNFETCELCRQLAIQTFWKNTEERPDLIYTSGSHADKELLLTAPYETQRLDFKKFSLRLPEASTSWVTYGDFSPPETKTFLRRHQCKPAFVIPHRMDGFWKCSF